jgi:hypothetical protein
VTPRQFAERMTEICGLTEHDREAAHEQADALVVEALKAAGYAEGAAQYEEYCEQWWYS